MELIMGIWEIILISIGLSMDAFAVSITLGLCVKKHGILCYLIPGIYFGLFQAVMPLIGYFAGTYFAGRIQHLDHWIAFLLLGFIGWKMIKESFSKEKEKTKGNPFQFSTMLLLAIATSIDALAVGITFAFLDVDIWKSIIIIGVVTLCLSMCGVKIGNVFGTKFKSKAEFIGGAVLVILGVKILIEHLFF